MTRTKTVVPGRARRRTILKAAKGNYSGRRKLFKRALLTAQRAYHCAYDQPPTRTPDFRRPWITRPNAAARITGLSYSTPLSKLKRANIEVTPKLLADLAVRDAAAFAPLA